MPEWEHSGITFDINGDINNNTPKNLPLSSLSLEQPQVLKLNILEICHNVICELNAQHRGKVFNRWGRGFMAT